MHINLKLMGTLSGKTPPEGKLELPDTATIEQALVALEIDPARIHVAMVNNKPQRDFSQPLAEGDELMVLGPVGGG